MNNLAQVVEEVEATGASLKVHGQGVQIRYRKSKQRDLLAQEISLLRDHRTELREFLLARATMRAIRPHVKLVQWLPKDPPVAIESCAVVVDVQRFIKSTLSELRLALADKKRRVGWTVPQLIDRLKQVGVTVEVDT